MGQIDETRVLLADHPGIGRSALAALVTHTPGLTLVAKVSDPSRSSPPSATRWPTSSSTAGCCEMTGLGAEAWIPKERADMLLPLMLADRTAQTA